MTATMGLPMIRFDYATIFASAALALVGLAPASAATVVPGFAASTLAANDDLSTGFVASPFALNFFGTTYDGFYVNNNGNITFNSPQSTFTPTGLGADYLGQPIIAPFFADIDTRGTGSGLVSYGTGTYAGRQAIGVTYPDVGYFSGHTDKTNSLQLILTDRSDIASGDFDIYFNYDRIQFETGDASGGSNGLGGTSAAAGYSSGTGDPGTYYQLTGSLTNGALIDGGPNSLVTGSNDGTAGQDLFSVRAGTVIAPSPVPLPGALPLLGMALAGLGVLGKVARRKPAAG